MKVLIVHYRYFISGGPERYMFNVKKALEDRGHEVIPFSIKNIRNEPCEYERYFVNNIGNSNEVFVDKYPKTIRTYLDLVDREFYSRKVKKALEKLIEDSKPDICYLLVYKRALSPSVVDACKKYNIPVINRISDYNPVCGAGSLYRDGKYCELCFNSDKECYMNKCIKGSRIFSLMRYLSIQDHKRRNIPSKIDAFVCTNIFMQESMKKYGYPAEKLHVIPTFFKEDKEVVTWNKTNDVDLKRVEFLFIGNIDESKGIYDLLNAFVLLKDKMSNFHLSIVGGLHADENKHVLELVSYGGLDSFVTFVPFMKSKEVFRFYMKTNVTILPTRWVENLPNTLVESIYFGRPVIVPNFGSFLYTTDDRISFRFSPQSVESLHETLLGICKNPEIIVEKSKGCERFFIEHYSENYHMDQLVGLFKEALA